jgi:hypothetical protein
MSDGAHLLIRFSDGQPRPALPRLEKLVARMSSATEEDAGADTLSMPHERVLAREYGIDAPDGCIPWAAWHLAQAGRNPGGDAWAWITPCHWRVGTNHVVMAPPDQLDLSAADSQRLLEAMQPWFEQDGIALEFDKPTRWLARGEIFRGLPSASLDRAVGRPLDRWMPRGPHGAALRRLQQEMQMLLYTHPVNDDRAQAGLAPVNSFWISGSGALPPAHAPKPPTGLQVRDWHGLDESELDALAGLLDSGRPVRVTVCGERACRTWTPAEGSLWQRLAARWSRQTTPRLLEGL